MAPDLDAVLIDYKSIILKTGNTSRSVCLRLK